MSPVDHQPTPAEFQRKRELIEQIKTAAINLCRARRAIGYAELTGTFSTFDVDKITIIARQSGYLQIDLKNVDAKLHMEAPTLIWDEAMLLEKMESL